MNLETLYQHLPGEAKQYPVETWHPTQQQDIGLKIDSRGDWWHQGALVRNDKVRSLFSRLLVKTDDHYHIVTPNIAFTVQVSGMPLRMIDLTAHDAYLTIRLADGRELAISPTSVTPFCLPSGEDSVFVTLSNGCEAQASRQLFYRLIEQATLHRDGRLLWHHAVVGYMLG